MKSNTKDTLFVKLIFILYFNLYMREALQDHLRDFPCLFAFFMRLKEQKTQPNALQIKAA